MVAIHIAAAWASSSLYLPINYNMHDDIVNYLPHGTTVKLDAYIVIFCILHETHGVGNASTSSCP